MCFYFQQFILTNILTFGLAYPHDGFETETRSFTITPKNFTIDMIEPRQSGSCGLYIFLQLQITNSFNQFQLCIRNSINTKKGGEKTKEKSS